jgi:hypothetical protein
MELWGSSYLLQEAQPLRLVGTIGSSTERARPGRIRLSFHQEPGVFAVVQARGEWQLVVKWDLALNLIALVHILVLQNRLLRGEKPELGAPAQRDRVFTVSGGGRASFIVCSWDSSMKGIECHEAAGGGPDQFELELMEEAAVELVAALAERVATNGVAAPEGSETP